MTRNTTAPGFDEADSGGHSALPTRRRGVLGAIATGALTGCLGEAGGGEPGSPKMDPETSTPTPTATPDEGLDPDEVDPGAVSSIAELAALSGEDDVEVEMEPGVYEIREYITDEKIAAMREEGLLNYLTFTGNNGKYDLTGVTIETDNQIREDVNPGQQRTAELLVLGNGNIIEGLTIENVGEGSSDAGSTLEVRGSGNTLRDCTLVVRGSDPYGYGGAFGVGDNQNGLRIRDGNNNRFLGCEVYMHAFGHGIYVQGDSVNTHFEDCYVEGEMHTTEDILAETSGPAYDRDFRIHRDRENWPGYVAITDDDGTLQPGGILSKAADGYRFYSPGKTTFVNCTAKNMRRGFAVEKGGPAILKNCVAVGNGNAFATGAADKEFVLENCRGDAKYGPLLTSMWGGEASVELYLLPDESDLQSQFHQWGLAGVEKISGGTISIQPWQGKERQRKKPITLGVNSISTSFTRNLDQHGRSLGETPVGNLTLENRTTMPVRITSHAKDCTVHTNGEVLTNDGTNITLERLAETDSPE